MANPRNGIRFEKWSGAGNDFVVLRAADLPAGFDGAELARLMSPRATAIGADGLLILDGDQARFWNPDGSAAAFCGNGARCIATLLLEERKSEMISFTLNGLPVRGHSRGADVAVVMPDAAEIVQWLGPDDLREALGEHAEQIERAAVIMASVPHLVMAFRGRPCWLLMDDDVVARTGALLSRAGRFGAAGVNVDFVFAALPQDAAAYRIRTFERGVAGETLACGTGAVAAARLILEIEGGRTADTQPRRVKLLTRSGDVLTVECGAKGWTLAGPARRVFRGEWLDHVSPK